MLWVLVLSFILVLPLSVAFIDEDVEADTNGLLASARDHTAFAPPAEARSPDAHKEHSNFGHCASLPKELAVACFRDIFAMQLDDIAALEDTVMMTLAQCGFTADHPHSEQMDPADRPYDGVHFQDSLSVLCSSQPECFHIHVSLPSFFFIHTIDL